MRAMLLAAGRGSRLKALTEERAKPAVPFANRPMAAVALGALARAGVTEIVVNTHHLPATVERALSPIAPVGVALRFVVEEELLGTGGGIANVAEWLAEPEQPVFVMNSDVLFEPDLAAVRRVHDESNAFATMVVRADERAERFGAVWVHDGRVRGIDGTSAPKPETDAGTGRVFTGVHVLSPGALRSLPRRGCVVRQGYADWLNAGETIAGALATEPWEDLGTPERYLAAHRDEADRSNPIDPSARIDSGATLQESWVGAGATIGPVTLRRVVVWDGATVDEDLEDAIVTSEGRVVQASE
ncbi:MAG: NDP-sugar synthase [Deltaproteobacteria bacterium]|nr:NDP-sugar synthase [Deltaproteobacteria bacterium]